MAMQVPSTVLTTTLPEVTLRELSALDAPHLFELIQANRAHLTSHGDYANQVAASVEDIAAELIEGRQRHQRFGILFSNELVGRVDLVAVDLRRTILSVIGSSLPTSGWGLPRPQCAQSWALLFHNAGPRTFLPE